MNIDIDQQGSSATLRMAGRFDLDTHREFNKAHVPLLSSGKIDTLTLDLFGVDYIDSSALGMLLRLNGAAEKNNVSITIRNCQPMVLQVLKMANFHRMFKLV